MTEQSKSCDICSSVCHVLLHQQSRILIQSCHWFHCQKVCVINFSRRNLWVWILVFCAEKVSSIFFWKALFVVYGWLGSQRFCEDENIARLSMIRPNKFIFLAHDIRDATNNWPRIHNTLTTRDSRSSLFTTIVKPTHHFSCDQLSICLLHLERDSKNHKHVVYPRHSHRVDIRENIATWNASLKIWVLDKRVEEVGSWY